MKKNLLVIFLLSTIFTNAQNDNDPKFWDNVRFGGGFGLGFGSNQTTIAISPSAIYEFNDMFALGLGGSYLYAKNGNLKSNVYGASFISLFNPVEEIQLSAEFEQLFVTQKQLGFDNYNFDYPALYLGAAYRVGRFAVGVRYDVLYDNNKSIFASAFSPIIRFYF